MPLKPTPGNHIADVADIRKITEFISLLPEDLKSRMQVLEPSFLENCLSERLLFNQLTTLEQYICLLKDSPVESTILKEKLDITFSKFFRNPFSYCIIEKMVLPLLFSQNTLLLNQGLRFWSAGCGKGEEAYSLAILLEEYLQTASSDHKYLIIATDLRGKCRNTGDNYGFTESDVENISLGRLKHFFRTEGGKYFPAEAVRKKVVFSEHDLLDSTCYCPPISIYGSFHLIFCSNVLIYYSNENRKKILKKLMTCLLPGGFLVSDSSERGLFLAEGFQEVIQGSAVFKNTAGIAGK